MNIEPTIHGTPKRRRLYRRAGLAERFWPKVEKSDGCWLWTGCKDRRGYGQLHGDGRDQPKVKAHRASWALHHGEIPDGLCVLHRCDTPSCVRPDHLFLGTLADNSRDCAAKGRTIFQTHPELCPRGEKSSAAKLTAAQVAEIRRRYASGETQTALGVVFNVTQAAIWFIFNYRTWKP